MAIIPQPEVLFNENLQNNQPRRNWKRILLIGLGVLCLGGVIFVGIRYGNPIKDGLSKLSYQLQLSDLTINKLSNLLNNKFKAEPKIASQGKLTDLINMDAHELFYASLGYDPKTGSVTQLRTSKIKGDFIPLYPRQPQDVSNAAFVYKIEVVSPDREVVQSGWMVTLKKIIQAPHGILNFEVATVYRPNAVVKVYLPTVKGDKLIWTGRML